MKHIIIASLFAACLIELRYSQSVIYSDWSTGRCSCYDIYNSCHYDISNNYTFPYLLIGALNTDLYSNSDSCGQCYEITCISDYHTTTNDGCCIGNQTVTIQITDSCTDCSNDVNHFSLSKKAYNKISNLDVCQDISITYRRVSCDWDKGKYSGTTDTNIEIESTDSDLNPNWYAFRVKNIAGYGDLLKVELMDNSGSNEWSQGAHSTWNYWEFSTPGYEWILPFSIRLTDTGGNIIVGYDIITNFDALYTFDFGSNFIIAQLYQTYSDTMVFNFSYNVMDSQDVEIATTSIIQTLIDIMQFYLIYFAHGNDITINTQMGHNYDHMLYTTNKEEDFFNLSIVDETSNFNNMLNIMVNLTITTNKRTIKELFDDYINNNDFYKDINTELDNLLNNETSFIQSIIETCRNANNTQNCGYVLLYFNDIDFTPLTLLITIPTLTPIAPTTASNVTRTTTNIGSTNPTIVMSENLDNGGNTPYALFLVIGICSCFSCLLCVICYHVRQLRKKLSLKHHTTKKNPIKTRNANSDNDLPKDDSQSTQYVGQAKSKPKQKQKRKLPLINLSKEAQVQIKTQELNLSTIMENSKHSFKNNEEKLHKSNPIEFQSGINKTSHINTACDDTASVVSDASSKVSSIGEPFVVRQALVAIIGIGDYDGLPNLPGVSKDYENITNIFGKIWKYHVMYKTENNQIIYTNDLKQIKSNKNYKLRWNSDEIDVFVEQVRKYVVTNNHDGLIFAISSHGDIGKKIYDSELEEYDLPNIFSSFAPEWRILLETYKETQEMSNKLFQLPKIFCVDCCRGQTKAKATYVQQNPYGEKEGNKGAQKKQKHQQVTLKSKTAKMNQAGNHSTRETFLSKSISKAEANVVAAQMSNFCKVWANVEGFCVGDGSHNGGLFLRNVTKVFKDQRFVKSHDLNDIILKIREYTKRDATLIGFVNFTQIVESESTMERSIRFNQNMSQYTAFSG